MPHTHSEYPNIPKYRFENMKDCTVEFLSAADNYYSKSAQFIKLKREMEDKIQQERETLNKIETVYKSLCNHKYVAEPREYHSSREWTCSICGDSC